MGAVKAGVLGGTFDPPHLGHLVLAAAARRALGLDRVLLVPAGDPWRKHDQTVSPTDLRVRMVRAATEPTPWLEVSTLEVERRGPSYSAETLDIENEEARQELFDRLRRMGVARALRRAGVAAGERVRVGSVELRWEP